MRDLRIFPAQMLLILALAFAPSSFAVTNLTVTPSTVAPDSIGKLVIEFDLGSMRNPARVDLVADFDRNGEVNGEEYSIESYVVNDNEQFKIQNTVYPTVPGDSDPTKRSVRIERPLPENRFFYGHYVIRVDDGQGVQQRAIEFQQAATSIQISGPVTLNHGSSQDALVVIELDEHDGDDFNILMPTHNGTYSAYLPLAATYVAIVLQPGTVSLVDEGGGAAAFRSPGDTDPVPLNVTSTNLTISGQVKDDLDDPVPYTLVIAQMVEVSPWDEELIGITITLANGNGEYSVATVQGNWALGAEETALHGYVDSEAPELEGIIVTNWSLTGRNISVSNRIVSLIKGCLVRKDNGQPVVGISVEGYDETLPGEDSEYYTEALSDSNGEIVIGVFPETWTLEILDTPHWRQQGLLEPERPSIPVAEGEVIDMGDVELESPEGRIEILVVDEGGIPLYNIGLYVNFNDDWADPNSAWVDTDVNGRVTFLVPEPGNYRVGPGYQRYEDHPFLISPEGVMLNVASGEVESVSFTMVAGGLIEGYLRGNGGVVEVGEIRVFPETATSIFDWTINKWLYYPGDRPEGIDYWIPLPPGNYLVQASGVLDNYSDTFGYLPEFANEKYDISLADVITVPGVGQRVRVDFDLTRGARVGGTVYVNSQGSDEAANGIKVEALNPSTLEYIARDTSGWSGALGSYELWLPAGSYLLRARPGMGTTVFEPVYYDGALDPAQAQTLVLQDQGDVWPIDFHGTSVGPTTLGDIDRNGRVEPVDLFSFSTVWEAPVDTNTTSLVANEDDSDTIDAVDLLMWLDRFREFHY